MPQVKLFVVICTLLLTVTPGAYAGIIRVSKTGNDMSNGSSWNAAKLTITSALQVAASGDQVWVALGTYKEHITLPPNVLLYGGFSGVEILLAERNYQLNKCILDGSRNGSVVTINATSASARIDGFVVTNGSGVMGLLNRKRGGGIYIDGSTATVANNTIVGNSADVGGGVYCFSANTPSVVNNQISGNICTSLGGGAGVYIQASVNLLNNTIAGNSSSANGGGAWFSQASGWIANNVITANSADISGGGLQFDQCPNTLVAANNTITGNGTGLQGGGVAFDASPISFANNIVAWNSSGLYRTATTGAPTLKHNCVYNPTRYDYNGMSPGTTDISADPALVSWTFGQVHIQPGSPCKNAGDGTVIQPGWTDIDSQARVQGVAVDIGADESDGLIKAYAPVVIRVSDTGDDLNDGSSWASTKRTVQAAVDSLSVTGGEVWVKGGVYYKPLAIANIYVHVYGGFDGTEASLAERVVNPSNSTVIDASETGSVIVFTGPGYGVCSIDGVIVQNGRASIGGGIYCLRSSPLIQGCVITGNTATYAAGGLYSFDSSPDILNNTFSANLSYGSGGGVLIELSTPRVEGNSFLNNGAASGGGIYLSGTSPSIINNLLSDNIANAGPGAGIALSNCAAVITGNTFSANSVESDTAVGGGGIYGSNFSGTIVANTISGNIARMGGGIYLANQVSTAQTVIQRNTISNNTATHLSGGAVSLSSVNVLIASNLVTGNTAAADGGGLWSSGGTVNVVNNTVVENSSQNGGGVWLSGTASLNNNIVAFNSSGITSAGTAPVLHSNCVYNPAGSNYSGLSAGTDDFSINPVFVNQPSNDFHLAPLSPCINAGWILAPQMPGLDIDGQARVNGASVDVGADEYVSQTAATVIAARLASNGTAVAITGVAITAAFPAYFYIESDNRQAGLRVDMTSHSFVSGQRVNLTGTVGVTSEGEKNITAASAGLAGSGNIAPFVVRLRQIGGEDFQFFAASGVGQQGVQDGAGLNNTGLLVKAAGTVVLAGSGFFLIDGGDGTVDASGFAGIRVTSPGANPSLGSFVSVVGVSSIYKSNGSLYRLLRARSAADVVIEKAP